jgi:hypothetical protein
MAEDASLAFDAAAVALLAASLAASETAAAAELASLALL